MIIMNIQNCVRTLKSVYEIPVINNLYLLSAETSDNDDFTAEVLAETSYKNISSAEVEKVNTFYKLDNSKEWKESKFSAAQDRRIILSSIYSKNLSADLHQDKELCFINIFNEGRRSSVNLKEIDKHGKVYKDGSLSAFSWSDNGKYLVYIAEKKRRKPLSFAEKKPEKETNGTGWGEKFAYIDDWGEQMTGQSESSVVVLDWKNEELNILNIPSGLCAGEVIWASNNSLIGVAYVTEPYRLGLIYCGNRESLLFQIDFDGNYKEIIKRGYHVNQPRLSVSGEKMVFLRSPVGGPHVRAAQLCLMNLNSKNSEVEVLIDYVETSLTITVNFYGMHTKSILPKRCWIDDDSVIFSTHSKHQIDTYNIDIETKNIKDGLNWYSNVTALDVKNGIIAAKKSSMDGGDEILVFCFSQIPSCKSIRIFEKEISCSDVHFLTENYEDLNPSVFFCPIKRPESKNKRYPLIVWPHGGPHSIVSNSFNHEATFFARLGYAILFPNYRGSLGQGKKALESLPGFCGTNDVRDVITATKEILEEEKDFLDSKCVALFGGSHGGFLVTHLAAQYPDMFKAVCARNPVIDIATMTVSTDIPDWNFVESGFEYNHKSFAKGEKLSKMAKMSPLSLVEQMKVPTLLAIGKEDRRVPPSQALFYHKMLLARNVPTKMLVYDDCHAISKVEENFDFLVQTAIWFAKYLKIEQE